MLSILLAICAMLLLYLCHRWQSWAYRTLLCSVFALSSAAHALGTRVWLGSGLFYAAIGILTLDLFHAPLRQWLNTWQLALLTTGAVTVIGWGLHVVGYVPLEPAIGMSLTALSLLCGGSLIYATLLIPNRHPLLKMAAVGLCAALSDIVVFAIFSRGFQIDFDLRLAILTVGVLSSAWFVDSSNFSKIGSVSQRRAFDSLV